MTSGPLLPRHEVLPGARHGLDPGPRHEPAGTLSAGNVCVSAGDGA
jgi:hypothetical protein